MRSKWTGRKSCYLEWGTRSKQTESGSSVGRPMGCTSVNPILLSILISDFSIHTFIWLTFNMARWWRKLNGLESCYLEWGARSMWIESGSCMGKPMGFCRLPRPAITNRAAGQIPDHSQFVPPAAMHMLTSTYKHYCGRRWQVRPWYLYCLHLWQWCSVQHICSYTPSV